MKLDRSFAAAPEGAWRSDLATALDEAGAPGFRGAAAFSDGLGTHDRCLAGLAAPAADAGSAATASRRRWASSSR